MKIRDRFRNTYNKCNSYYESVKEDLLKAGNLLTGNKDANSAGYSHTTTCAIMPYGGFGILHTVNFDDSWINGLDEQILRFLRPFDVDIIMFCDTCIPDEHEQGSEGVLMCDYLVDIIISLLNSINKEKGADYAKRSSPESISQIRIEGNIPVNVTLVKALVGLKELPLESFNLDQAKRTYLDFSQDAIQTSTRFRHVKARAALAHKYSITKDNNETIYSLNESKEKIMEISKNLDDIEASTSGFGITTKRIQLREDNLDRNAVFTYQAILEDDVQTLINTVNASKGLSLEVLQKLPTDRHLFVYQTLVENDILNEHAYDWNLLSYFNDIGFIVLLYKNYNSRFPTAGELEKLVEDIEKKSIDDVSKPSEIFMVTHGGLSKPNISFDLRDGLTYGISGIPGLPCYNLFSRQKGNLKDAFSKIDITTFTSESLPFLIEYSVNRGDTKTDIEFFTIDGIQLKDIVDIYILSSLLFLGETSDRILYHHSKPFTSTDIANNLNELHSLKDVKTFISHSCLVYEDEDARDYYNRDTVSLRSISGGGTTRRRGNSSREVGGGRGPAGPIIALVGCLVTVVCALVPRTPP